MKPRIVYYSDCSFFAGCENMIANFLDAQSIKLDFSVTFAYNHSEKYEQGLNFRVKSTDYQKKPLNLLKQLSYHKPLNSALLWSFLHKLFFALFIPVYKYFSIIFNTIILFKFFKSNKPDILHINNGGFPAANSCYSAVIAAKIARVNNIVYVVNNLAEDYKHPFRWFDYPIDFCVKKWVTIFITGSDYAGDRLRHVLALNRTKHLTINNGIQKRAITLTKEEFKEKYSIPKCKIIASVVANLEKRKGHIYLLNAIILIKKQYPPDLTPIFIFEGTGPEKSIIKQYIKENELQDDVLMIDYIPDIFNLLYTSDMVILPSIANEDFPNVVIEAMSLGKPVIGTNIAGIPEQIENNKTGYIVKPQNPVELKEAIIKLSSDSSLLQQFSDEAKMKFDSFFEKTISIQKYYNLYKSLI